MRHSLSRFWNARVPFTVAGRTYPGFATLSAADPGQPFWGGEGGSLCNLPLWDFQNSDGTAGGLFAFLRGYESTDDKAQLRRATAIGETLLYAQNQLNGGWFQDGAVIDGIYRNVGVWGEWDDRRQPDDDLQNWFTLDDSTSASCAMALLRLYQAGGDVRFLNGARRFADVLVGLKDLTWAGIRPYGNGGIPQVLPLSEAFTTGYQANGDNRNPDGPYQPHKTLNDGVMPGAMIFLMEIYAETGNQNYLNAVRLNVDYLLTRQEAGGGRGWSQQYHWRTDAPAWGRAKEPPSYVTCETNVVDALLLWRERETQTLRRLRIEVAVANYLYWLRDEVPHPNGNPDEVWRYYNHAPATGGLNLPVFAADYVRWVGAQHEYRAEGGQGYRSRWDLAWVERLADDGSPFDFSLAQEYLVDAHNIPLSIRNPRWSPTAERPDALFIDDVVVNGQQRRKLETTPTVHRFEALARTIPTLGGLVVDSDGDGFGDDLEIADGSDPYDSESLPAGGGGDVNCDGVVSLSDISPFVQVILDPAGFAAQHPGCSLMNGDFDQNGVVGVGDIALFIDVLVGKK